MASGSFAFTKWYVDCLDRRGRLVILYWAALEWRGLRLTWHSVTDCVPGSKPRMRSSVVPVAPPVFADGKLRWTSARLDCDVDLTATAPTPPPQALASGVTWTPLVPAGRAAIRHGDESVVGSGYAEVITLKIAPWRLGIDRLRWGRWIGDDASRSVVWIEWNGDADKRWVFLDGRAARAGGMSDGEIAAGGATLSLDASSVLVDRGLSATVARLPALRALTPRWLLGGHEVRRTRAGSLTEGQTVTRGVAVDEIVDFG